MVLCSLPSSSSQPSGWDWGVRGRASEGGIRIHPWWIKQNKTCFRQRHKEKAKREEEQLILQKVQDSLRGYSDIWTRPWRSISGGRKVSKNLLSWGKGLSKIQTGEEGGSLGERAWFATRTAANFTEGSPCSKHRAKCFTLIKTCNPYNNEVGTLIVHTLQSGQLKAPKT